MAPLDVLPVLLLYMLVADSLGAGRCADYGNHRQRRRVNDQCQKPYREFAHASLRLSASPHDCANQGGSEAARARKVAVIPHMI